MLVVLSIAKLGAGRVEYYLSQVASGVEDYYVGAGEAPGVWVGGGVSSLGLHGEVEANDLRAVLAGLSPSGTQLARAGPRTPGFDLTFSAPKSVSLMYALGDRRVVAEVRAAHESAVAQAMDYLERWACRTRRGAGGTTVMDAEGFLSAAFQHRTSRAGDPQLHTHVLVPNLVLGVDGRWSAVDARFRFANKMAAGYLYRAALRWELTQRLGVDWTPVVRGTSEIAGIDRRVLAEFSQRRRENGASELTQQDLGALKPLVGGCVLRELPDAECRIARTPSETTAATEPAKADAARSQICRQC